MDEPYLENASASSYLSEPPPLEPMDFHRRLPSYRPTPCVESPSLAERLNVGEVWVKDESTRLDLPSFKGLGAFWGAYVALTGQLGDGPGPWESLDELAPILRSSGVHTLIAPTDGNHGRAVARFARLVGLESYIFVPAGTVEARISGIEAEGAVVDVVAGSYDDAVRAAAAAASDMALVVSDTAWAGYDVIPRAVIDGYSTIFREIDQTAHPEAPLAFDLVAVQIGVGALAASVVRHFRSQPRRSSPKILGVEPILAACVLASMKAGRIVTLPGSQDSIMAGLNCGTPSRVAWPDVKQGLDALVAIDDAQALDAMRALASAGIVSGESGAAGLGGLLHVLTGPDASERRSSLGVTPQSRILVLSTEGATDPVAYERALDPEKEVSRG